MKLREYLEATKTRQEIFSKHVGITHRTLVNALQGKEVLLSTAMKIEKATCGAVTCQEVYLETDNDKPYTKKQKQQQQNQTSLNTPIGTDNAN